MQSHGNKSSNGDEKLMGKSEQMSVVGWVSKTRCGEKVTSDGVGRSW